MIKADNIECCLPLFLHQWPAVVSREHLLDVGFPIEDFAAEYDIGYLALGTILLQGASADFQPGDHLLVGHIPFSSKRRMKTVRELIDLFRTSLQGVQRRRDASVLRRDYVTVIHLFCGFSGW